MPKNISLNDAIEEYLTSRTSAGLAYNTVRSDRSSLRQLLGAVGNINTKSLEPRHMDMLFAAQSDNQASSRNMLLTRVRCFIHWCIGRNYINHDPTREMRKMRVQKDGRLFVPVDEFDNLLGAGRHPRDRVVMALGIYLFLRVSEIQGLRVGDVDLEAGEVKVIVYKTGDFDVMPICEELDGEMRTWLTWYAGSVDEPLSDEMLLVPSKQDFHATPGPSGGRFIPLDAPITRINPRVPVSRPWTITQKALASLGYPTAREGGHTLRRSGARALFDTLRANGEGYDGALQTVKTMLHHKNVATTEHYLGVAPERAIRDARLKGRPMFRKRSTADNVVKIRRV